MTFHQTIYNECFFRLKYEMVEPLSQNTELVHRVCGANVHQKLEYSGIYIVK